MIGRIHVCWRDLYSTSLLAFPGDDGGLKLPVRNGAATWGETNYGRKSVPSAREQGCGFLRTRMCCQPREKRTRFTSSATRMICCPTDLHSTHENGRGGKSSLCTTPDQGFSSVPLRFFFFFTVNLSLFSPRAESRVSRAYKHPRRTLRSHAPDIVPSSDFIMYTCNAVSMWQ